MKLDQKLKIIRLVTLLFGGVFAVSACRFGGQSNMNENANERSSVTATPIMPAYVTVVAGPAVEMSIEEIQTREAFLNNTHLKVPTPSPVVPPQKAKSSQGGLILIGLISIICLIGVGLWMILKRRKRRD